MRLIPIWTFTQQGQAVVQCEMISDCYAQDTDNDNQETMRALAFNAEGCYISSLSLNRMGLLQHRHMHTMHTGVFEEDVVALLQRYKHGNESTGHTVHISDLWQLSTNLHDILCATFPIYQERFASPLDVQATTQCYWTPFAADSRVWCKNGLLQRYMGGLLSSKPPLS